MISTDPIDDDFDEAAASCSWLDLRKSDYCRVIFCDLSTYDEELGAGCRFQITDHVHEDPNDYVGLYRVGWKDLTERIAYKLLSEIECEENGKMLRCVFKGNELQNLQEGYYQFLYVTSDNEVCGASTPFEVKKTAKDSSDEDVVADKIEDDFLVVRSNLSEKNTALKNKVAELEKKVESLELENKILAAELGKNAERNIFLLKVKQAIEAEHQGCPSKVESLETSIQRLTESNDKYQHSIFECSEKITEQADELKKSKQEINKYEDINCHLRSQIKQLEKIAEDKRIQFENQNQLLENTKSMLQAAEESKRLAIEAFKKSGVQKGSEWREPLVQKYLLNLKLADAEKSNEMLRNELKGMEAAVVECNQVVKQRHLSLTKCTEDNNKLRERLDQVTSREHEMKDTIEDLRSKCGIWEEAVADVQAHCADLNKSIEEKDSENSKLKDECLKKEAIIEYLSSEKDQLLKKQTSMSESCTEMGDRLRMAADLYKEQYIKINSLKKIIKCKSKVQSSSRFDCLRDISSTASRSQASGPPSCSGFSMITQNSDNDTGEHVRRATLIEKMNSVEAQMKQQEEMCSHVHLPECNNYVEAQMKQQEEMCSHVHLPECHNYVEAQMKQQEQMCFHVPHECNVSHDSFIPLHEVDTLAESDKLMLQRSVEIAANEHRNMLLDSEQRDALHQRIRNLPDPFYASTEIACSEQTTASNKVSLPCTFCDASIEVDVADSHPMVLHLEDAHRQKTCPICGLLFDMNQPPQYFVYHVEDHLHNSGNHF